MNNRKLILGTAAASSLLYPIPLSAQGAPTAPAVTRDGAVEQAIQDTIAANLKRRGYAAGDPVYANTAAAVRTAIDQATSTGGTATGVAAASRTWAETIRGLINDLASGFTWPLTLGKTGQQAGSFAGGGTFGGGGSSGSWDNECDDVKIDFDVSGNLIIPSFSLKTGLQFLPNATVWSGANQNASTMEAVVRWQLHRTNSTRIPQRHYGVVGYEGSVIRVATIAYRDNTNTIVPRESTTLSGFSVTMYPTTYHGTYGDVNIDIGCPNGGSAGGDFHFYGDNMYGGIGWNTHNHSCTMYAPNPELGEGGYFINKNTSISFNGTSFPDSLAAGYKACLTDPVFIKRLADAFAKKASATPGTAPYEPITDQDARPRDTKVIDLKDNPSTGNRPAPDQTSVDTSPPTATPPPPPPPTSIDLGADPNIGTPGDPSAPTNIMDPVFDWLPDLPTIELNTAGAQCPTWTMQPFQGPEWTLVMDKHCPFIADNAALISTIMILGFTIGSAMIILRA